MESSFHDKVVFVTGGASGIGEGAVRRLAELGAKVAIADINVELTQKLSDELNAKGYKTIACPLDVSDHNAVKAAIEKTVKELGALDYGVNSAGIGENYAPVADYDIDYWKRMTDINYNGMFYAMKYELVEMLKKGAGSIVNISSIHGEVGAPNSVCHVATKHGVDGMTKVAALDYATQNIRVNAICPAFIDTPLLKHIDKAKLIAQHPNGRMGKVEEVAGLIVFLLSDEASFITGACYMVDGGLTAR